MLKITLIAIAVVSIAVLYKFLPNRKVFMWLCLALIATFAIAGVVTRTRQEQETISQTEINALQGQQQAFTKWYTQYQREIEQLDRNWQVYHNTIESFTAEGIELEQLQERLGDLETEARIEQVQIYTLKVPEGLGDECNLLTEQILKKTRDYADAQTQTIALSKATTETEGFISVPHQEQVQLLQDIIIREAPAGLFTATELSEILAYFKVAEDYQRKVAAQ